MTATHLLAVSVGPVQDFIAAARRMGDLSVGSQLLSDISRAVAQSLADNGGGLIFPAPSILQNPKTSVANVILTEVPTGQVPANLATMARKTAEATFRSEADKAFKALAASLRQGTWNNQVDDVIEVYSAWVPRSSDYRADRDRVMSLLAARKATRDFRLAKGEWGLPKSSLDGQRETVLENFKDTKKKPSPQLRLSGEEQLDCVGVVKRYCSKENRFASISTVAASSWLARVKDQTPEAWNDLANLHEQLIGLGAISWIPDNLVPTFLGWEYEASPLYESRHKQIEKDAIKGKEDQAKSICTKIADLVRQLSKAPGIGKPDTYYAMIMADGDRMGEALSELKTPEAHRKFSSTLEGFASDVPDLLEKKHPGVVCIYAGGDDVLAFAPLDQAVAASATLARRFTEALAKVEGITNTPTLSVGMVIVHIQEPLAIVRELAKRAEKLAKEGIRSKDGKLPAGQKERNALCVSLHTRGTDTTAVRGQWDHGVSGTLEQWRLWFKSGQIPSNLPYATRRELEDLRTWSNPAVLAEALPKRLRRIWKHKEIRVDDLGIRQRLDGITTIADLDQLIAELRVARFLAMGEER